MSLLSILTTIAYYNMTDWLFDNIGPDALQPVFSLIVAIHDALLGLFSWSPTIVDGLIEAFDLLFC